MVTMYVDVALLVTAAVAWIMNGPRLAHVHR
jgi:hypothetical protein